MQISIELNLKTREVYQLFQRKISGDRLFIAAILHQFNRVMGQCKQQNQSALVAFHQVEQSLSGLTQTFREETSRFEALLMTKENFTDINFHFVVQFRQSISVCNALGMRLVEFINTYDQLIATLKLLQLADFFESIDAYFTHIKRIQKSANRVLSQIIT